MKPYNRITKYLPQFHVIDDRRLDRVKRWEKVKAIEAALQSSKSQGEQWRDEQ
jgi:hypothetical protein